MLSRPITDHDEIRQWAVSCKAVPAEVSPDQHDGKSPILQFMFLDGSLNRPELTPISWEDFFAKFDLLGFALAYEDNRSEKPSKTYELRQIE